MSHYRRAAAVAATVALLAAPAAQAKQGHAAALAQERYYSSYADAHVQPSPDAQDVARGVYPGMRPVRVVEPAGSGFDWTDAGIGAATSFGLVLVAVGGGAVLVRRRAPRTMAR